MDGPSTPNLRAIHSDERERYTHNTSGSSVGAQFRLVFRKVIMRLQCEHITLLYLFKVAARSISRDALHNRDTQLGSLRRGLVLLVPAILRSRIADLWPIGEEFQMRGTIVHVPNHCQQFSVDGTDPSARLNSEDFCALRRFNLRARSSTLLRVHPECSDWFVAGWLAGNIFECYGEVYVLWDGRVVLELENRTHLVFFAEVVTVVSRPLAPY
jgi:hypothetical protein